MVDGVKRQPHRCGGQTTSYLSARIIFSPGTNMNHVEQGKIDLLLVDDDAEFLSTMEEWFRRRGHRVQSAPNAELALECAERRQFQVAVLDLALPGMSGIELLERLKASGAECEVIILTGEATIETAVKAIKLGAFDYLTKPARLADLERLVEKAEQRHQLGKENRQLRAALERAEPVREMIGRSAPMREVFRLIERAGPTDKAILIQGESGTGKELVARALHRASPRAARPLVVINCAALPESLLESELFGHEKGAFTGAIGVKQGLFEVADGGTLFVDEIGELAGSLQAKMLRVLEDGTLRRIGSIRERRVDVRLLAATNRNLADEVKAGRFREDLYYRINVMSLQLPTLRERTGDIPLLIDRFLGDGWELDPAAREALLRHSWPGNVRQLINALERAKIMADDHVVRLHDLPQEIAFASDSSSQPLLNAPDDLATLERSHVVEILNRERGNKARCARALGINRRTLYRLLEKYNISPSEGTKPSQP